MIGDKDTFSGGSKSARDKLNRLRSDTTAVGNIRGDNLIHVVSNQSGYSFTFDVQKLISMLPTASLGASGLRLAYCKTAAGTGSTIVCYLDTDTTGQEITVNCILFESSNLNTCKPTLTDGQAIPVFQVGANWYCAWWFMLGEAC